MAEPASDADLLAALPRDPAAFETFYGRYFGRVAGFAARRCSCPEDVADVTAQTFVHLIGAAERYDPARAEPAAFVLGIAANVVRDLHRRRVRGRALVTKLAGRDLLDADDVQRIDAAIDAARAAGAVRGSLDGLPPGERDVVRLVAGGSTPGEVADELGISPGAAWTRLSRARRRLRALVIDPSEGEAR